MIDLDSLRVVDYYQWLNCGRSAAQELGCNQSTVSRKWKGAQWLFGEASIAEELFYVDLERHVHQRWRFAKGRDLRVHMYAWINRLLRRQLPASWVSNPLERSITEAPALRLLEGRVIDALCAPYPMIAELDREKFALLPLYSTQLVLLVRSDSQLANERALSQLDVELATRVGCLDFVPIEAGSCSLKADGQTFAPQAGTGSGLDYRYWGTSLSSFAGLKVLDYKLTAPYAEFLVVRREWEQHAETLALLRSLGDGLAGRSSRLCDEKQLSVHCLA